MEKLLIVGSGGHGRCCLDIAKKRNCFQKIDFLDDKQVGTIINSSKVIGKVEDMSIFYPDYSRIFIAVGNNQLRKELMERAVVIGYEIETLISESAFVSNYAKIESGSVVFPNATVEANGVVSKGCIVASNSIINHDAYIEDYVLINTGSIIRPEARIGSLTSIGCQCMIAFGKEVKENSIIYDCSHIK